MEILCISKSFNIIDELIAKEIIRFEEYAILEKELIEKIKKVIKVNCNIEIKEEKMKSIIKRFMVSNPEDILIKKNGGYIFKKKNKEDKFRIIYKDITKEIISHIDINNIIDTLSFRLKTFNLQEFKNIGYIILKVKEKYSKDITIQFNIHQVNYLYNEINKFSEHFVKEIDNNLIYQKYLIEIIKDFKSGEDKEFIFKEFEKFIKDKKQLKVFITKSIFEYINGFKELDVYKIKGE